MECHAKEIEIHLSELSSNMFGSMFKAIFNNQIDYLPCFFFHVQGKELLGNVLNNQFE